MSFDIDYSEEKNEILKRTRGVCFEDVKKTLEENGYLGIINHHNKKSYPNQKILVVKINNYAYAVPYVYDSKRNMAFLKTVYPDRRLTKSYLNK